MSLKTEDEAGQAKTLMDQFGPWFEKSICPNDSEEYWVLFDLLSWTCLTRRPLNQVNSVESGQNKPSFKL